MALIVFIYRYLRKINKIECPVCNKQERKMSCFLLEEHKVLPMLAWEIGTRLELGFSKFINWEIQEGPERGEGVLLLISHAFSTR